MSSVEIEERLKAGQVVDPDNEIHESATMTAGRIRSENRAFDLAMANLTS